MSTYIKYLVLAALLAVLGLLLPQVVFSKLVAIGIILLIVKFVFFDYIDLFLIYKKARETATGAGMIFLSIGIILSALIISGV